MADLQPFTNADQAAESLSGVAVGRFVIGDRLGKGGMGEVYLAQDTKLKRQVALKRLAPALRADSGYRRRFQEEAERASRFSDSHVAALYDVMEDHGEMFLVMEYIEGETLRQRLRRPLTLEQFFEIATQCAEALSAAHERGIVHCDIKPENIMLTTAGQVKILDFGVAKHLPRSDQSSTVDRSGSMGGTPAYMSPEVLLEKIPDGRADVFSLGVVFYEALTGHHPFLAGSFVATTDRIRSETPTPIRIFNSQVPDGLEALVSKAMAKEPGQRYAGARELLEDIRLVQAGLTPTKLQPVLPAPFVRKPARWAIGLTAAALIAAAVFTFFHRAQSTPILSERGWVLVGDFDSRGDDPIPDAGVREGLTIALQQSRYVNVFPRSRVYDTLQRMKKPEGLRVDEGLGREICQRENLQVLLTGSIEHLGKTYQITVRALDPVNGNLLFAEKERFDNKEEFFDKVDALAKKARKDLGESIGGIEKASRPLAKVTTTSLEALQLYSQAKDAANQGKEDQVLPLFQGALQLDPDFAMAHAALADYYTAVVGKNQKASAEMKRAYDLRQSVTDREQRKIEADYFTIQERYEDAAQSLRVLVSLYPDDEEAHTRLAGAYYDLGQIAQAITEFREVLRLNPTSTPAYRNLVLCLAFSNQPDEAIRTFREAQSRGITSPPVYWGVGLAYLGKGDVAQAREEFHHVAEGTATDADLADLYLAFADLAEGKFESARTMLLRRIHTAPDQNTGLQLVRRNLLGRIALLQGKPQGAIEQADAILRAPESELQTNDILSAGILYVLAGSPSQARDVWRRLDITRRAVPSSWNNSSFHNLEGEIAISEGQWSNAQTAFAAASAAYPQALSHIGLARTHQAQQQWQPAAAEWEQVLGSAGEILQNGFPPDLGSAHLELARISRKLGNLDAAREHYAMILQMWKHGDSSAIREQASKELKEIEKSKTL